MELNNKSKFIILVLIIMIGAFFRFYKLDWGQGLFTHPDEYHIVIAVNQLSFPTQMNPNFFSYGTVTIYLIYFTKLLLSTLNSSFLILNYFLIGRFYSALFSTLSIIFIYLISKRLMSVNFSLIAAASVTLTAGLIQQAHFTTPESNLIFFLLGSLLFLFKFVESKRIFWLSVATVFWGFALGVKVSSVAFAPVIFLSIILAYKTNLKKLLTAFSLTILITLIVFFTGAPFVLVDFSNFISSFNYESGLAKGQFLVFYTRQFIETTPILFQLTKIYPFALGLPLLLFGIGGFFWMVAASIKDKKNRSLFLILNSAFLILFLPNAFLFAKWARFVSPTFPFFSIFAAFFLYKLSKIKLSSSLLFILGYIFLTLNFLWVLAFFSIYVKDDVRITASTWLINNSPQGSMFLVEGGNMVDLPLSVNFKRISLDFYALENEPKVRQEIIQALDNSDYFLVQSRRVFKNHQRLPQMFPLTATFYSNLFSGKMGFTEIKEFHSYPQLNFLGWTVEFPDEDTEETWSVFDHPVVRVFQKTKQLSHEEYSKLLGE